MGKGYIYKCPKCGHSKKLITGRGFMASVEAAVERENILAGNYGPKAQATLVAHPEAFVDVKYAVYQCGACDRLESRLTVRISGPVQIPILQQCNCGATMHRIRGGKIFCPACRAPLGKAGPVAVTLWD